MPEFIRALEWDRFIEYARNEARTSPGKAILEDLKHPGQWASDESTARTMQQETQEMVPLLDRDALWGPLTELTDPQGILNRLSQNSVLEVADLVVLRQWLYAIDSWTQIPREEIRGERFKKALSQLPDPFNILRIIDKILTPDGELSENASPKLGALYREIRRAKKEIQVLLEFLMRSYAQKGLLQESYTDIRDGRYVIPVKISSQHEVPGIIHEASASRQTVFIEPGEITALNNKVRQLQNNLIQEIFLILEETSKRLRPFILEIQFGVSILTHWDVVQAKARMGLNYSGKPILVSDSRQFQLQQTAHPLLWWSLPLDSIIRNDITFEGPAGVLLLTGPNTGGKTVLLKTLGLASICARTGFPFPATEHPVVPFFDSIYTDLGDPQSIERHLSSFSGHVLILKRILDEMTSKSLILIDELNSATDPEEGAAFARAILETFIERGALAVTTTHDPYLKAYAASNPKILCASMTFDEASKTPTYTLAIGIPGRSRALETVARLGIPREVIELSEKYLSEGHKSFEKLLATLEEESREAIRARKEAVATLKEAERMKSEWTTKTQVSINELIERTRHKLKPILEQAQDEVRASVRKLDEAKHRKDVDSTRQNLNLSLSQAASKISSALEEESPEIAQLLISQTQHEAPPLGKLEVGASVRIPKWKSMGTVLEILGSKIKIAMGSIQMILSSNEIEALPSPPGKHGSGQSKKGAFASGASAPAPDPEVDLRGQRLDDAMAELERYLDQAYRSDAFAQVKIIHGLGTGALREGTRRLLKKLPYVKVYRDGASTEGGTGATIVEFDRN